MTMTPWVIKIEAEGSTLEEAIANFEKQVTQIREEKFQCTYASNTEPNIPKLFSRRSVAIPHQEPLSNDEICRLRDLLK